MKDFSATLCYPLGNYGTKQRMGEKTKRLRAALGGPLPLRATSRHLEVTQRDQERRPTERRVTSPLQNHHSFAPLTRLGLPVSQKTTDSCGVLQRC